MPGGHYGGFEFDYPTWTAVGKAAVTFTDEEWRAGRWEQSRHHVRQPADPAAGVSPICCCPNFPVTGLAIANPTAGTLVVTFTPVPSSVLLVAGGAAGLGAAVRRRLRRGR